MFDPFGLAGEDKPLQDVPFVLQYNTLGFITHDVYRRFLRSQRSSATMLKEVELKLIAELMKNSNRSDRELAKVLGVSQPTVTRVRAKLGKEGFIREYTIIPDFHKLGLSLCVFTFGKFKPPIEAEKLEKHIQEIADLQGEIPQAVLLESGVGENAEVVTVSFHKTYSDYLKFLEFLRKSSGMALYDLRRFIINLEDKDQYRYLTFRTLAMYLLEDSAPTHPNHIKYGRQLQALKDG